ncbi:hypothetical protein M3Y99_00556800 [Aphelenchoides fujianensis]|nr:hypothetical protein M3Y99_00556800 [Aphelenchoides fujianensis]
MTSLLALLLAAVLLVSYVAAGQFDRSKAVGPCIRGKCPEGHTCHRRECYPARMAMNDDPMEELFDDAKQPPAAIGPCIK